jgi:hypothetical protein
VLRQPPAARLEDRPSHEVRHRPQRASLHSRLPAQGLERRRVLAQGRAQKLERLLVTRTVLIEPAPFACRTGKAHGEVPNLTGLDLENRALQQGRDPTWLRRGTRSAERIVPDWVRARLHRLPKQIEPGAPFGRALLELG